MTVQLVHALLAAVLVAAAGCGSHVAPAATAHGSAPARSAAVCARPYSSASPWNTPIGKRPRYDPAGALRVRGLGDVLTSDPTQYTYPVYVVDGSTPRRAMRVDGIWSDVAAHGHRLVVRHSTTVQVPIPDSAAPASGSDSQIVLIDRRTGDEWGAWQIRRSGGGWRAENGYHYDIDWSGVPPRAADGTPFGSRGAGVPYLAGLVRACEIARGRIDHALAFAYDQPGPAHVYPATKSDGQGRGPSALPEGTRLQLNPALSAARLRRWGCRGACLVLARALQRYGMYVIDSSGRAKVMLEYEGTARWRGAVSAATVSPIPLSAFRVLETR